MNPRTGKVRKLANGRWCARITYTDEVTGKRKDVRVHVASKAKAHRKLEEMKSELANRDALAGEKHTFEELASFYAEHHLQPAQYAHGRKVAGLRSWYTPTKQLETLRNAFGKKRLRSITHADLKSYRADRLKVMPKGSREAIANAENRKGAAVTAASEATEAAVKAKAMAIVRECDAVIAKHSQRTLSIASVNRELQLLNHMLTIAQREGWIVRNAFDAGERLISTADEAKRQRILTAEEERALLAACDHPNRGHLRPIIICALDTGMRFGEIQKLQWSDVDFSESRINVRATNTKTQTARRVPMSDRLRRELKALFDAETRHPDATVFGISSNVKRSFATAQRLAGISGLRFHDLRHTAATRLVNGGMDMPSVGRILGHTQPRTTYRYINAHEATIEKAAAILNAHAESVEGTAEESSTDVN